jgi:hypothetical protein
VVLLVERCEANTNESTFQAFLQRLLIAVVQEVPHYRLKALRKFGLRRAELRPAAILLGLGRIFKPNSLECLHSYKQLLDSLAQDCAFEWFVDDQVHRLQAVVEDARYGY